MAKKVKGKIVSKRTRTMSTPYRRPKTSEAGPSHRQPAEPIPSGSGYELPNQSIYPNSPEPQSATGTDFFVESAEPRLSGSGYGLPNQESYPDSPGPQCSTDSPLESFTIPSRSPPATTANIAVVLASCRKRKSVQDTGDSKSPQNDSEDTTPKKRAKLETNISTPIPKVASTLVTSATTSSSDVFTFSPPIKIKTPVSIQNPSCSSEEQVQLKFTFSPATSITRHPPIYSSSNISPTTMTSSAETSCSITVKTGILSKGSTSKAKKRVQFESSISLPITKRPKVTFTLVTSTTTPSSDVFTFPPPVSFQSSSCSSTFQPNCFSMPTTSTAPIESTETPPPIKSWTRPFKRSSRNTFKNSQSISSTPATHTPPEPFRIGQGTSTRPAPSQSSLFSSNFQPSCFSMPTTSTAPIESTETPPPIKSWTRPFKRSSRNTFKNSQSISSTPATHTPPEPFRIGQGTSTPPAPSQSPLFSSNFQPSCFSMPTTSTAPIESTETPQPIKSWTRPFKRSSRRTLKKSPSTSSAPATHTPPEPFRIGQGTNTRLPPSQSPLFSSTLQSSSFAMGQDSAGTSQQPSPFSAASNLDQQSSSPSSTVPSKKQ